MKIKHGGIDIWGEYWEGTSTLNINNFNKQLENSNADIILSKNYDTSVDVGIYKIGDNFKKDRELMRNITVDQVLTHIPGKFNFYHAKTHGYIICNVIKLVTGLDIDDFLHYLLILL